MISHIYWFSSYHPKGVSVRYRALYPLQKMAEKNGISYDLVYPGYRPVVFFRFLRVFLQVLFFRKKNSLIVFQKLYTKGLFSSAMKVLLRFRRKATLYDTDDADHLRFEPAVIHYFMKNAEACSTGSEFLVSYIKQFNQNVFFLGSPVMRHSQIKTSRNTLFTIGWIGDFGWNLKETLPFSHKRSMWELVFPALKDLHFPFRFIILGVKNPADKLEIEDFFTGISNAELEIPMNLNWEDEEAIYARVKDFDIGLAPLVDHDFNKGKSAFKAKQYFSCAVPVLGSPVGENLKLIEDGSNGYFCESPADYGKRLTEFHEMSDSTYDDFQKAALNSFPSFSMECYCRDFIGLAYTLLRTDSKN